MRNIDFGLVTGALGLLLSGCAGISDCKDDGAQCAAMLNRNAEKCAIAYQARQGDEKRKACEKAVKVVGEKKVKEAEPGLLALLAAPESGSSEDHHRQDAVKALARIGDPALGEALVKAIDFNAGSGSDTKDKNASKTNEELVTALGELKYKAALPKLIELAGKAHDYAQVKAIRALGAMGDPSAIDTLNRLALDPQENPYVRKMAVVALGDIGDLKATDALIQMMFIESKGNSFYREASFALFQLGPGVADALLDTMAGKNEKVNQYFEKNGGQKDAAIKTKCGVVLTDFRDRRAVQPLIDAFQTGAKGDALVLVWTAHALGILGDPAAVPVLKAQMMDVDASKREPLMMALNQIGDRSVVSDMIKGMTVKDFVERCVKEGYGTRDECASPDTKAQLQGAQKSAADAASNLGGPEALEDYKKVMAQETDTGVKAYGQQRLPRLEAAAECKANGACWAGKLKSPDPLVREKAAWELGRIKDPATIAALGEALGDAKPAVRSAAIMSYWIYGDASVVPAIEKRLEDEVSSADFAKVNEDLKRLLLYLKRKK